MSSLPTELDFTADPAATPARMDKAMAYIIARLRAVEAVQPDFLAAVEQLKAVGLQRVTEALVPVLDQANAIADALEAIQAQWESDLLPEQVVADTTAAVTAAFADYRHRYLGAKATAPTQRDDESPVAVGDMYFDTSLDQMRVLGASGWKDAGSSVAGIMEQIAPIVATAGQTVFTIPGGYDVGYLILTVNGSIIPPADYTATNGTSVTLTTGLSVGDELAGIKFGAVTLSTVYTKAQVDSAFAAIGAAYTKAESDARYATLALTYSRSASDGRYARNDFSNLTDAAAARTNLGIGSAGTRNETFFVQAGGVGKISVGTTAPTSPSAGDLWVDTN